MKISYRNFYLKCAVAGVSCLSVIRDAGCSSCVLASIKKGRNIRPVTLKKIASALGVSPEELLEGESRRVIQNDNLYCPHCGAKIMKGDTK